MERNTSEQIDPQYEQLYNKIDLFALEKISKLDNKSKYLLLDDLLVLDIQELPMFLPKKIKTFYIVNMVIKIML